MRIVITGGCGFLGRRLALLLLEQERRRRAGAVRQRAVGAAAARRQEGSRSSPATSPTGTRCAALIAPGTDAVFHLAAIVSGQAEADTDLGYRVNLDGTRAVLDACRALGSVPRVIFASSLAVYGGALPPAVGDDTALTPQSSYGTQKAIGELLVNDYSRKGFVDGRALRLPTVVVRPGLPNRAASTFASSMIREPLTGEDAVCPVSPDTVMALASPRRVVAVAGACARYSRRGARAEPYLAASRLFGVGRRDGRGAAPRRRSGGLCPPRLAARPGDPGDRRELAGGTRRAARRGARLPARFRHRRGRPVLSSRTTSRCRRRWSGEATRPSPSRLRRSSRAAGVSRTQIAETIAANSAKPASA